MPGESDQSSVVRHPAAARSKPFVLLPSAFQLFFVMDPLRPPPPPTLLCEQGPVDLLCRPTRAAVIPAKVGIHFEQTGLTGWTG